MFVSNVYQRVIEPSLAKVAIVEVRHVERHNGREYVISHLVRKNVLTAFDAKLSRHLAAVKGEGLPQVSVAVRVQLRDQSEGWRSCPGMEHPSVPHALVAIARRAIGQSSSATLRLYFHDLDSEEPRRSGQRREVERDEIEILEAALRAHRQMGDPVFVEFSGDLDLMMLSPPGDQVQPIVIDLVNRRLTVPAVKGLNTEPITGAMFDFDRFVADNHSVRTYLATARQQVSAAKERAVLEFRAAAEDRIIEFDQALNGRSIELHRLEAMISLISRLKAGLGEGLAGLSEAAQITAFEWAAEIDARDLTGTRHAGTPAETGTGPARQAIPIPQRKEGGMRSAAG